MMHQISEMCFGMTHQARVVPVMGRKTEEIMFTANYSHIITVKL